MSFIIRAMHKSSSARNSTTEKACQALLREPVAAGTTALAEGHRRAVARLADRIGRPLTLVLAMASMGLCFLVWWAARGWPGPKGRWTRKNRTGWCSPR